jgi:hypothetical protein
MEGGENRLWVNESEALERLSKGDRDLYAQVYTHYLTPL